MKPARFIAIIAMISVLGACLAIPILLVGAFSFHRSASHTMMEDVSDFDGQPVKAGKNQLSGPYHSISQDGRMDVVWQKDAKPSFDVSGPADVVNWILYELTGGDLKFGMAKGHPRISSGQVTIVVHGPQPGAFSLAGAGTFKGTQFSGGNLAVSVAGTGSIDLAGAVDKLELNIAGKGDVRAKGLKCSDAEVSIAGRGNVDVSPAKTMNVNIAGMGDVTYHGNPDVEQSIFGKGNVRRSE